MPPDLSPDEVRDRSFDTALRGYDKPAVDRFRSDVADEIDRLHRQLETSQAQLNQLGIDDVETGELPAPVELGVTAHRRALSSAPTGHTRMHSKHWATLSL